MSIPRFHSDTIAPYFNVYGVNTVAYDISSVNGITDLSVLSHADSIAIRAQKADGSADPLFNVLRTEAQRWFDTRFFYIFAGPEKIEYQAITFCQRIGSLKPGEGTILDAEVNGLSADEALRFGNIVEYVLGVRPVLYSGNSIIQEAWGNDPRIAGGYRLWYAWYTPYIAAGPKRLPPGYKRVIAWQPGIDDAHGVDLDIMFADRVARREVVMKRPITALGQSGIEVRFLQRAMGLPETGVFGAVEWQRVKGAQAMFATPRRDGFLDTTSWRMVDTLYKWRLDGVT